MIYRWLFACLLWTDNYSIEGFTRSFLSLGSSNQSSSSSDFTTHSKFTHALGRSFSGYRSNVRLSSVLQQLLRVSSQSLKNIRIVHCSATVRNVFLPRWKDIGGILNNALAENALHLASAKFQRILSVSDIYDIF
jgi:hypothetical protein